MVLEHSEILPGTGHEAGRRLLEQLYRRHTGLPMPPILVTDRGKPYWEGNPLFFSISHTPHHVFCALSNRPVGIDAEELDRSVDLRLAEKILSAEEKTLYDRQADKRTALLRFWVLKEAAAKCTGQGLRGYPNHTCFSPDDPRVRTAHGCVIAVIEEDDHAV